MSAKLFQNGERHFPSTNGKTSGGEGLAALGRDVSAGLCVRQFHAGKTVAEHPLPENGEVRISSGAVWKTVSQWSPVAGHEGCFDLHVIVTLVAGEMPEAAVSVAATVANWDREAYVLMPGIVYAGNRFDILPMHYPPLIREREKFRLDMPTHMTAQPHLRKDGGSGEINLDTGHVTTPAMGFRDGRGRGFLMLTHQRDAWGNLGLTVEEDNARNIARFIVSSPRTRANALGWKVRDWRAGDSTTLRVRFWSFRADKLQVLFDRFAECRKDLNPAQLENSIPLDAAARLVRDKWNKLNWDEKIGLYLGESYGATQQANRWQLGWISGLIVNQPLFQRGDELTRQRVWRDLDFVFRNAPARSGFFHGSSDGRKFYSDSFDQPHPHQLTMVRKQGDALYYALRQLIHFRKHSLEIPPAWEGVVRGLADAFVRTFKRYGQVGQFLNVETGEICIGGSAAGGIVPAGLVLAAQYFDAPEYLKIAEELAGWLEREALAKGLTTGGPGEALAAPDSESCYALVKSFVVLFEATERELWGDAARDMIRQFATWVVSYDYAFPPDSPMGKIKARSTGSVVANTQNQHSAPGICTHSGDDLLRFWRATGDEFALELLRDIVHGIPQYVSRADRPVDKLAPGMICERVNLSDWEGQDKVGGHIFGSCAWPETAMLLTAAEIPGVHVRTDTGRVVVFDHVEAELKTIRGQTALFLRNSTRFDTRVSLLVEDAAAASKPLALDTLANAQWISIAAGKSVEIILQEKSARAAIYGQRGLVAPVN